MADQEWDRLSHLCAWRNIERVILKNGLRVLKEHRPLENSVRLVLGVNYGSSFDKVEQNGLAHLLEHMLFRRTIGRSNFARARAKEIESVGGKLNACTSQERIVIYSQVPSNHARIAFETIPDMAFNSTFPPEELVTEKKVVLQEIAEHNDELQTPPARILSLLLDSLYKRRPFRDVLGDANTVNSLQSKDLIHKYNKYFVPNNMVLGIFGTFNKKETPNNLKHFFGSNPRKNGKLSSRKNSSKTRKPFKTINVERRDGLDQAQVMVGLKTVPLNHHHSYALDVMQTILGRGTSSRLFTKLRGKKGLTYTAYASHPQGTHWGCFYVHTSVKEKNLDAVLKVISREFAELTERRVKADELKKAKNMITGSIALARDSPVRGATSLVEAEMTLGNVNRVKEYIEKIDSLSASEVLETAREYFLEDKFATAILSTQVS